MGFLDIFKFGRKEEKVATLPVGAASRMRPVYGGSADCFKNSAFWSCVTLISSKLATLPLTPHEEKRNGGSTTMDRTRALYNLLQSPNPYMSHHDFFTIMALNYLLPGQAIAILERAKNGIVINMYPVSPSCVHSQWVDGVQLFTITGLNGAKTYRREDLLIVRGVPMCSPLSIMLGKALNSVRRPRISNMSTMRVGLSWVSSSKFLRARTTISERRLRKSLITRGSTEISYSLTISQ